MQPCGCTSTEWVPNVEMLPSLHDMLLSDWGDDLPISGGNGQSRVVPIKINSPDPDTVARTQMQVLRGLGRGRGVYWRWLGRELLGDALPRIEKCRIETVELTPEKKVTQTEAYYFDVSDLRAKDWKPIKGSERLERLNIAFPCEIDWLHLGGIIDNEPVTRGAGITLGYGAPDIKATLYIYDLGREVPDDLMHESVQSEFERAASQIVNSGSDIVAWPDPPFDGRCLRRYFMVGPEARDCTLVALTARRRNFVKMRVSWRRDEFIDRVANGWVVAVLEDPVSM